MTAHRPLPDIAADLRDSDAKSAFTGMAHWPTVMGIADELDALDATHVCVPKDHWPTADEIAELRAFVATAARTRGDDAWLMANTKNLTAFLDRFADLLIDARLVAAAHAQWADTEERGR